MDARRRLDELGERHARLAVALAVRDRFGEVHGNQLGAAIALAAFLSLFPLLLVGIAVVGFFSAGSGHLATGVISHLGLTGKAARFITDGIAVAERSRRAATVIGVGGLLWGGLGLVAALQYAFDQVWQAPERGFIDKLFGLLWLTGAAVIFIASSGLVALLRFLPGWLAPVGIAVGFAADAGLFLWTARVLTNRDVGWRPLLPGAVLGAVGLAVLKVLGSFWVPRVVASSSALYGSLGAVFAVLAFLLLLGRLVVSSAVLNVVLWERRSGTARVVIELPGGAPAALATRTGRARPVRS